ncbi:hypothetical protein CSIM01_08309 [Colletotrichum simmondsii]|uniref:Uncharacterized protein n=1 Tax=Colletotrichum simmondsii TaxID=703756 RepID=A0A135RYP2_9PEZI|nr:hypothetical protein CSIM01_08309 [Colletotrichum simmondsii]
MAGSLERIGRQAKGRTTDRHHPWTILTTEKTIEVIQAFSGTPAWDKGRTRSRQQHGTNMSANSWSIALRRSKGSGDGTGTANVAICWSGEIKRIGTHIRASVRIGRLPEPVTPHIWNASRVENRFCRLCSEVQH